MNESLICKGDISNFRNSEDDLQNFLCNVVEQYENSLITLILYRLNKDEYYIVFSNILCIPNEIKNIPELNNKNYLDYKIKNDCYIYFYFKQMKSKDAITWYYNLSLGKFIYKDIFNLGNKKINVPVFFQPSEINNLLTSKNLPFVSSTWGVVRSHHLMPLLDESNKDISNFLNQTLFSRKEETFVKALDWCELLCQWQIRKYIEYYGSCHLVLPNSLYRKLHVKLNIDGKCNNSESILFSITKRNSADTSDLYAYIVENKFNGYYNYKHFKFDEHTNSFMYQSAGSVDKIAYIVYSNRFGIIDYNQPSGFIRNIQIHISNVDKKKYIFKHGAEQFELTGDFVNKSEDTSIESAEKNYYTWINNYIKYTEKNKISQDYVWIHNNEMAIEFVKNLIKKARRKIVIIDPYFAVSDMFTFVPSNLSQNIALEIVTSRRAFKTNADSFEDSLTFFQRRNKEQDLINVVEAFKKINDNIKLCMLSNNPEIHDRFIIIDDFEMWHFGDSLNNIGHQKSLAVKIKDFKYIYDRIIEITRDKYVSK